MNNREYISTLVSRMRFAPQTIDEVLLLKTHLLAEFHEQDEALNVIMGEMLNSQIEKRMNKEHERRLDQFFENEVKEDH